MRIVGHDEIVSVDINYGDCWEWVNTALEHKKDILLPPKISIDAGDDIFYNTMPVVMPSLEVAGVKLVNRYPSRNPVLDSKILLYDLKSGEAAALLDGNFITNTRTGAVAVHSADLLGVKNYKKVVFVGLGNTARATALVLAERHPNRNFEIRLVKYKNQHELFSSRFEKYGNLVFSYWDTLEEAVVDAEIVFSAVTVFHKDVCSPEAFPKGVTLIPIHTRGFMQCDLAFDKIFGDDYKQISHFKYFDRFPNFAEVAEVVRGEKPGREHDDERLLVYNIGIAAHDFYFAHKLLEKISFQGEEVSISQPIGKFWA